MQSVYFLPTERSVVEGEELSLTVIHDDYSLWYGLQTDRYLHLVSSSAAVGSTLHSSNHCFVTVSPVRIEWNAFICH